MAKKPTTKKKVVKKKVAPHIPEFTPEQESILRRGLNHTWNDIGYDVMRSIEENEGRTYITQAELLEVVCDAGYCMSVDPEAGKLLDQLFKAVDMEIDMAYTYLKKFFPYPRYS